MDTLALIAETWQTYHLTLRTVQHLEMFALSFLITVVAGLSLIHI